MKRSEFNGEENAYALREVESGPPAEVCRHLGVSETAHRGVSRLRQLRFLEDETAARSDSWRPRRSTRTSSLEALRKVSSGLAVSAC